MIRTALETTTKITNFLEQMHFSISKNSAVNRVSLLVVAFFYHHYTNYLLLIVSFQHIWTKKVGIVHRWYLQFNSIRILPYTKIIFWFSQKMIFTTVVQNTMLSYINDVFVPYFSCETLLSVNLCKKTMLFSQLKFKKP